MSSLFVRACAVANSCRTGEQLNTAIRYSELAEQAEMASVLEDGPSFEVFRIRDKYRGLRGAIHGRKEWAS